MSWLSRIALRAIRWYQSVISPKFGRRCRFEPTCSQYARLAIERHGFWKGCVKTIGRLRRCHYSYLGNKIDYP